MPDSNSQKQTPDLPPEGYIRLPLIVGDRKAIPPIAGVYPIGRSTWWEGVRTGRFPKAYKIGPRTTAWRVEDIRELIKQGGK